MLTIKKVPTLVSNYQEDSSEKSVEGCGRNCLGNCCLPGSKLPLYAFKKDEANLLENEVVKSSNEQPKICFLHNLLLGQWDDRSSRGLFRYDVKNCQTKIIPGRHGFIAQLNEGRHLKKRPTEFRVDQVLQAFDENKFNFSKVGQEEVLFRFEESDDCNSHYFPCASVTDHACSPSVIAINVSPIECGHVLLIPHVLECLPQNIAHENFLLALHMAKEAADPFFRVGYNSLGAFATINHLHFQAYFLAVPFPVEKASVRRIKTVKGLEDKGVTLWQLLNYPVRGFAFEGGYTLQDLSDFVASSCIYLQNNNIPFNVLITDCGKRIFLFPQCYAEKQALGKVRQELLDTQVNPGVWEIGGHIVMKRSKDFQEASETNVCQLLAEVSLSEERFRRVKAYIWEAAVSQKVNSSEDNYAVNEEASIRGKPSPETVTHLPQDCAVIH